MGARSLEQLVAPQLELALEQATRHAEAEVGLELAGRRPQHTRARLLGARTRGVQQRGLADPGRALHEHHGSLTRARSVDEPRQLLQLPLAVEQRERVSGERGHGRQKTTVGPYGLRITPGE